MFSGKTTDLLRRLDRLDASAFRVFKHVIDTRYSQGHVVSHGGKAVAALAVSSSEEILIRTTSATEVVAIDEAHFFDRGIVDAVQALAGRGVEVIVTSLNPDSWGRPFPVAERLLSMADEPIVRNAICARCQAVADRTQRLTPIVDGNLIGGPESYEARCRTCWSPPPESAPVADPE